MQTTTPRTIDTTPALAGHPYRAMHPRVRLRVELPTAARTAWLATRSALAAVLLSLAVAVAASGCGAPDPAGPTPDDAATQADAPAVVDAARDAQGADATRPDAPRTPDAAVDADTTTPDVPEDAPTRDTSGQDVARVDAPAQGSDAGRPDASPPDTGPGDAGSADAGPPRIACSTGADCPAFASWTCDGVTRLCRCTPGAAGAVAGCGTRDNDCDGVADPETVCPTSTGGSVCVNTLTTAQHCGGCGRACPGRQNCVDGACSCTAPGLQVLCGAVCVDMSAPTGPSSEWCAFCGTYCSAAAIAADPARMVCCRGACYPTPPGTTPAGPVYACVTRPRR